MAFTLNRVAAFSLLLFGIIVAAGAGSKDKAPCKVFFVAVEQDEATVNLKMAGLNRAQNDWYKKKGNQGQFAGVCLVKANETGERVPLESGSEQHISRIVGEAPLYMISWEQHRLFIPDELGGHYALSGNGILSRWDASKQNGQNFVPVGPVHNTNRTILSSVRAIRACSVKVLQERTVPQHRLPGCDVSASIGSVMRHNSPMMATLYTMGLVIRQNELC